MKANSKRKQHGRHRWNVPRYIRDFCTLALCYPLFMARFLIFLWDKWASKRDSEGMEWVSAGNGLALLHVQTWCSVHPAHQQQTYSSGPWENSSENPQKPCQGHQESEQPALLSCLKGHREVCFIMAGGEDRVRSVHFSQVTLHRHDVGEIKHSYTCIMLATSNQKPGACYYFLITYMRKTDKQRIF